MKYLSVSLEGDIFDGQIHIDGPDELIAEWEDEVLAVVRDNPHVLCRLEGIDHLGLLPDADGELKVVYPGAVSD